MDPITIAALISAGVNIVGSLANNWAERSAQEAMATSQTDAITGISDDLTSQLSDFQESLAPYLPQEGQQSAFEQMQALTGAAGADAQRTAIQAIQESPELQAMIAQGEQSILQNASATGGLRGGNTQAALAQFSPAMLNQAIQQRYQNLGGLAQMQYGAQSQLNQAQANMTNQLANLQMQQAGVTGALEGYNPYATGLGMTADALGAGLGTYTGLGGDFGLSSPNYTFQPSTVMRPTEPLTFSRDYSGFNMAQSPMRASTPGQVML